MLKLSQYPFHTLRENEGEKNEPSNALLQAGYIRQEVAGAYSYLPLGLKVLEKIKAIIRKHLEAMGSYEIQMTAFGAREHWETTGRDTMDILFTVPFADGRYHFLNPTHEEIVTPLMKEFLRSYKDLPTSVFQIQTKFRNEKRAKSGILRGREFLMKDMYSFHINPQDLDVYYQKSIQVYHNIFEELGIGDDTFLTYASGGTFSKYSHEFQTLLPLGEDTIYLDRGKKLALSKEIIDLAEVKEEFKDYQFEEVKASEVGNIFKLMTRFSDPFELKYRDHDGNLKEIYMGCYGIGVSRIMGVIAEKYKDEHGLVWPKNIAPYDVYVLAIGDKKMDQEVLQLIEYLEKIGKSVIYDDRDISPGTKLRDAELLGIPERIIVSEKSLGKGGYELQERMSGKIRIVTKRDFTSLNNPLE